MGIERGLLQRDRALAHRFDVFNASALNSGPQRFACEITNKELWVILVAVAASVMLPVLVILSV
ncbi:hypothetical protein [Nonomuraea dietziae]|uniref:hypothetical protein n=1 Tax=Nonomuraea dietziae TaxID=65515 RepID=UPI0033FDDAB3